MKSTQTDKVTVRSLMNTSTDKTSCEASAKQDNKASAVAETAQNSNTTFTLNTVFALELVAAKPDQCRPGIENIGVMYSDKLKRNVAISTNGRAMAVVPVEVPEDVEGKVSDCLLSPQALKACRKIKHGVEGYYSVNGKIEFCDGSALPVPDKSETGGYVDWQRCLIDEEREKQVFSIGLNPQLLLNLAKAIGSADGIKLTFYTDNMNPMKVTPTAQSDKGGQFGILMPMRIS